MIRGLSPPVAWEPGQIVIVNKSNSGTAAPAHVSIRREGRPGIPKLLTSPIR